jgi:hypothetical protein
MYNFVSVFLYVENDGSNFAYNLLLLCYANNVFNLLRIS